MYAVVQTGGKQYRVSEGDVITVEKLNVEAGSTVALDQVLVIGAEGKLVVGKPYIEGAAVKAEVVENGKGEKLVIFKYKAKKDYRRKQGHRQPYTKLEIKAITAPGIENSPKAEPEAPAAAEEVEEVKKEEKRVNLKSMKKAELIEYAKENGIEINEKATNADLIAAIEAALK